MMSNTRCKYGNDVSLAQRLPLVEANATGDAGESVVSTISCTCFLHACNFPMWFWIIRVIMYLWTSPFQDVKCQSDTRYMHVLLQRIRQKKKLAVWVEKFLQCKNIFYNVSWIIFLMDCSFSDTLSAFQCFHFINAIVSSTKFCYELNVFYLLPIFIFIRSRMESILRFLFLIPRYVCQPTTSSLPYTLVTGHLLHLSMERAKERLGLKDDSYERDQKQEALHRHNITNYNYVSLLGFYCDNMSQPTLKYLHIVFRHFFFSR